MTTQEILEAARGAKAALALADSASRAQALRSMAAVSYTHLDVYKRQGINCCCHRSVSSLRAVITKRDVVLP